jgi:SAM-dependent methyltransferase
MSGILRRLLFAPSGRPTALLRARMHVVKFAATRGWVIPLLTVRSGFAERWRHAARGSSMGYQHYLETDEIAARLLAEIRARAGPQDAVLDLGCNVGRDLNELWKSGYRRLTGVEIGLEPVRAMREVFPEMAAGSRIINKSMTEAVRGFGDAEFELVYTHGSLSHVSAREQFVFDHMCRIARRWIVTMENEWSPLAFPRDLGKVFADRGMAQEHAELIRRPGTEGRTMLRVFRK